MKKEWFRIQPNPSDLPIMFYEDGSVECLYLQDGKVESVCGTWKFDPAIGGVNFYNLDGVSTRQSMVEKWPQADSLHAMMKRLDAAYANVIAGMILG